MTALSRLRDRAAAAVREGLAATVRRGLRAVRAGPVWIWARRLPARAALAIAFAAGLTAVSIWAILAQAGLPSRLPAEIDWAAARALFERDARPGDAIALSPPWAERAREVLPASLPVLAQSRFAAEDLIGVRRIWLVSLPDAPRFGWDAEVDLLERASRSEAPLRLGGLTVIQYDLAFPTLALAFLPDRVARATVSLGGAPCPADSAGRFRCGGGHAEIERSVRDIGGIPRPCLSAITDGAQGAPLVIEFPAIRVGRAVHGHAEAAGAPFRIAVRLEGEEVGAADLSPATWTSFRIDTTRFAGQNRALALVLTSPGPLTVRLDAAVLP